MRSEGALPGVIHHMDAGPAAHKLADMAPAGPLWSGNFLVSEIPHDGPRS